MPTNAQSRVVWRVAGENVRALASGGLAADDFQGLGASSAMYSSSPKGRTSRGSAPGAFRPLAEWRRPQRPERVGPENSITPQSRTGGSGRQAHVLDPCLIPCAYNYRAAPQEPVNYQGVCEMEPTGIEPVTSCLQSRRSPI